MEWLVNWINPLIIFVGVPLATVFTRRVHVYTMMIVGSLVSAAPTFLLVFGPDLKLLLSYFVLFSIGEVLGRHVSWSMPARLPRQAALPNTWDWPRFPGCWPRERQGSIRGTCWPRIARRIRCRSSAHRHAVADLRPDRHDLAHRPLAGAKLGSSRIAACGTPGRETQGRTVA